MLTINTIAKSSVCKTYITILYDCLILFETSKVKTYKTGLFHQKMDYIVLQRKKKIKLLGFFHVGLFIMFKLKVFF